MGLLCLLAHTEYDLHVELGNSDPRGEQLLLDSVSVDILSRTRMVAECNLKGITYKYLVLSH